jgi:hypothetical protein
MKTISVSSSFSLAYLTCYSSSCRYMAEQVPLAKVDVDDAVKAKFGDLVADAGTAALRVLLMGHAMEVKHELM